MKVVCVNGSPRGKSSNTSVMLESIASAYESYEPINLVLGEMKIKNCTGCYSCWTKTPGLCVQKDDMEIGIDAVRDADVIILGSPLYFNNISGTLKIFIDRLTALGGNPHQESVSKKRKVKIIMVSNCGFPFRQQFDVVSMWIKHFTKMLNAELIAEFYITNGKMLRSNNLEEIEQVERYKNYLKKCSKNICENGVLAEEYKVQLQKEIKDF